MRLFDRKTLMIIAWALVVVAIAGSVFVGGQRIAVEKEFNDVQMLVNYTELASLANGNDLSDEELAKMMMERGLGGILFKETSLGDLQREAKIEFYLGEAVQLASYYDEISKDVPLNNSSLLIVLLDSAWEEQVVEHVQYKIAGSEYYPGKKGVLAIPINTPNSGSELNSIINSMSGIGVGFEKEVIKQFADLDLAIVPQLRTWKEPSDDSLEFMAEQLKNIPNLSYILFNDKEVPGTPDKLKTLSMLLKDDSGMPIAPVGAIEFSDQDGVPKLAMMMEKDVVRLHSIPSAQMSKYDVPSALDRWVLAVEERNMRSLLVRFFDMDMPALALDKNLEYMGEIRDSLMAEGFNITKQPSSMGTVPYSGILALVIGLGVVAGAMLLVLQLGWNKLSVATLILGVLAWVGLFFLSPVMARKLMALASVVVFPTLSFQMFSSEKGRSMKDTILGVLKVSGISLIGAVLMVGLLSDKAFMLKLNHFSGVKLAHVIPLALIPVLVFLLKGNPINTAKKLLNQCITYKFAILAGLAAVVAYIYLVRTGNDGAAMLSDFEVQMRATLKEVLGVRPRNKEFLIGYPFLMVMLYFGLNMKNWFIIFPAIIGQISLVNTYAHLHTPLLISIQRSFNGLVLGLIVGAVLILVIKLGLKWWKQIEAMGERIDN